MPDPVMQGTPQGTTTLENVDVRGALTVDGTQVLTNRQSAISDASTAHALNAVFSDTEAEAALNALGTKVNAILAVLRTHGLIAP